jgi:uncharacterized membrane protein
MIVTNAVNINKRDFMTTEDKHLCLYCLTSCGCFAAALLFNREMLDSIWQSFRSWPMVIQIVVGLLVLPVALGLWIWQTPWPIWLRLILVVGLGLVTIYVFFPRKTRSQAEVTSTQP